MIQTTLRAAIFLLAGCGAASATPLGDVFNSMPAESRLGVQRAAQSDEYYTGSIDGVWGRGTEQALGLIWDTLQMGGVITPTIGAPDGAGAFLGAVAAGEYADDLQRIRTAMPAGEGMD